MLQQESQAAYLSASSDGATQLGLHIVVYNALAGDLLRAGEACRSADIAGRCSASNRALLVLGHLEAWADELDDAPLVKSLKAFYQGMRHDIVRLQVSGSFADFDRLSETVQKLRAAWQTKEQMTTRSHSTFLQPLGDAQMNAAEPPLLRTHSAWRA